MKQIVKQNKIPAAQFRRKMKKEEEEEKEEEKCKKNLSNDTYTL